MQVTILSLKKIEYQGQASAVNMTTTSGQITILNHHRPLVSILTKGRIVLIDPENIKKTYPIQGGFIEMSNNNHLTAFIH